MKITLINHASIYLEEGDFRLLQDPWFSGGVFNDSWKLEYVTPKLVMHDAIKNATHIYISHEHPDHFNFPALKSIYAENKDIVFLIQDLPRKDVLKAINSIGFKNVIQCKHRQFIELGKIRIYMYSIFPLDSALAVSTDGIVFLNVNDTDMSHYDLRSIKKDIGKVDLLFNQFSFATYNGSSDVKNKTSKVKSQILKSFVKEAKFFDAKISVPFASFSIFSQGDNSYLNDYRYDINKFVIDSQKAGVNTVKMLPGDEILIDADQGYLFNGLGFYEKNLSVMPTPENIPSSKLEDAFFKSRELLYSVFPKILIGFIGDMSVYCPDLKTKFLFNFQEGKFLNCPNKNTYDLEIYSQPFYYSFNYSWGMQSLTIGGRVLIKSNGLKFMYLRILLALADSNINLNSRSTYQYFYRNFGRIFFQILASISYAIKNIK